MKQKTLFYINIQGKGSAINIVYTMCFLDHMGYPHRAYIPRICYQEKTLNIETSEEKKKFKKNSKWTYLTGKSSSIDK